MPRASVYLLHSSKPLAHAQHYCGYTPRTVAKRLHLHETGRGSRLCKAYVELGATLTLARVWRFPTPAEARAYERKLKDGHNLPQYCPICRKLAKRKAK
jgi:predicted GIY-YIG superfamily endonuclease